MKITPNIDPIIMAAVLPPPPLLWVCLRLYLDLHSVPSMSMIVNTISIILLDFILLFIICKISMYCIII